MSKCRSSSKQTNPCYYNRTAQFERLLQALSPVDTRTNNTCEIKLPKMNSVRLKVVIFLLQGIQLNAQGNSKPYFLILSSVLTKASFLYCCSSSFFLSAINVLHVLIISGKDFCMSADCLKLFLVVYYKYLTFF